MILVSLLGRPLHAQWVKTNGPYGGPIVNCFATVGTKLFAGVSDDGVYLSTDSGVSWKRVSSNLPSIHIYALANDDGTLLAATSKGLFSTVNDGASWYPAGEDQRLDTLICYVASIDSIVFAAPYGNGIFRSSDHGNTWTHVDSVYSYAQVSSFASSGGFILSASDGGGIIRSFDNGVTWEPADSGLLNKFVSSLNVSGAYMFAATMGGIFVSTDHGGSWTESDSGMTIKVVSSMVTVLLLTMESRGSRRIPDSYRPGPSVSGYTRLEFSAGPYL